MNFVLQRNRKGILLFSLLWIIFLVAVFAFTMNYFVNSNLFRTRKMINSRANSYLLRSAVACAIASIQKDMENNNSEVFNIFMQENLTLGQVLPIDSDPLISLAESVTDGSAEVEVIIASFSHLDNENLSETTGGYDYTERIVELKISAQASCGGLERSVVQYRTMKIVNILPGIVGKFSFYLKNPESEESYNRYANNINGWDDSRSNSVTSSLPIMFYNGGELDNPVDLTEDSWKNRGYIYIGDTINLNLTAGDDPAYGEHFHFRRLGCGSERIRFFPPDQPETFSNPPEFTDNRYPTENTGSGFAPDFALGLANVLYGYFTESESLEAMNYNNRLDNFFSDSDSEIHPDMRSSIFHFFGNISMPSPTLVLGNVRRRYVTYSGIVVEYTGENSNRDAFITYLPNRQANSLNDMFIVPDTVTPSTDSELPAGTEIIVDTLFINAASMFDTLEEYYESASTIVEEPYLRSHDFLYHKTDETFYPQMSSFGEEIADYQYSFKLELASSDTGAYFNFGSLDSLSFDYIESKTVYILDTVDELSQKFKDTQSELWKFNAGIIIEGKEDSIAVLPALTYSQGGILVFKNGNIQISKIERDQDPDQNLTICVLNGNIELDCSHNSAIEANLIVPRGRIINLTSGSALNLNGSLLLQEFPADSFPAGGKVSYNPSCDPSGSDYSLYYRGFVADIPSSVIGG